MAISNQYKDTLDNLIDSSDNSSNTNPPAILRQIVVLSNDIPSLRDNASGFKEDKNILDDGPQGDNNKKVNDNEDVRILAVKSMKIATTIISAKPAVGKLWTVSATLGNYC